MLHERLRREAQAMAKLAHPNVVTVHEVDTVGERIYIAMELVEGQTFGAWMREQPRGWREIVAKLMPAGEGLAAAHEAGLVHRDFKPENVFVGKDGRVRVGDFGLARPASPNEPPSTDGLKAAAVEGPHTQTGSLVGTPFYMAPEQFLGHPVDARTDQFSFCVALYVAIVGEHPFGGGALEDMARAVCQGQLRPPPRPDPLPRWLRRVLARGLAVDPEDRYPSMKALLGALGRDPRRRLLVAAGVALPLLALGASAVLASRAVDDPHLLCQVSPQSWAGVWDGTRATAVDQAFAATHKPYAARAAAGVRAALDQYVQRWNHAYTEACEATRVRGAQSEEMLDKRMLCLDERKRDLRALTDSFVAADAKVVAAAAQQTASLGELADCNDVHALAEQVPPPKDPAVRARVDDLRSRLDALDFNDQYAKRDSQAAQQLGALVEQSRATGYRPIEAEALLALSKLQRAAGDLKAAVAAQEQGIWAAEASRFDKLAAKSWLNLMMFKAEADGKFDDALALTPRVTALLERMGGDAKIEGLLHLARANILQWSSKLPEALAEASQGVEGFERLGDALMLTQALGTQANIYWDLGKIPEAQRNYERVLAIKTKELGEQHPEVAMADQDVATALSVAGRHQEAIELLLKAQQIFDRAIDENHPAKFTVAHNLGLVYNDSGQFEKSVEAHQRAIKIAEAVYGKDHPSYAMALMSMAAPLASLKRFDQAAATLDEALALMEKKLGPEHVKVAYAVADQADLLLRMGKYEPARAKIARALAILEKQIGPDAPDVCSFRVLQGQIEIAAKAWARALPPLERAARCPRDGQDPGNIAQLDLAYGQALYGSGRDRARGLALVEQARAHFAQDQRFADALAEADRWLKENQRGK
jgi:eukaryotic-like serine/threonine-protein kinase